MAPLDPSPRGPISKKSDLIIAVGGKTTLYYLPLTIAEQLGYFKDEGLSVEIQDFPGGSRSLQALIGGSADVVSGRLRAHHRHADQCPEAGGVRAAGDQPWDLAGHRHGQGGRLFLAEGSQRDAVGVTAPGSSTQMMVNHLLASVGLTPDDVSIVGVGTGAQAIAAMRGGQLDAISNVDPVMMLLEGRG